jgi:hypothetical protein
MNIRVIFHIQDVNNGVGIPNVLLRATSTNGNWQGLTNSEGNFDTGKPEDGLGLTPGKYLIHLTKDGYKDNWIESPTVPATLMNSGIVTWGMERLSSTALAPVSITNREFIVNGGRYRPIMCTDFLLIYRYIQGHDIRPILEQRKNLGFDMVRILTMAHNIVHFSPQTYDVKTVLSQVLELIHDYDLRAEVEGFADVQFLGLSVAEQQFHHKLCNDIIRSLGNIDLYDLCNEYDKNGINPDDFVQPTGTISSRGSRQNNKPPKSPYWSFGTYHPRRDGSDYYFSKYRADVGAQSEVFMGVEGEPVLLKPAMPDEPIGFADVAIDGKRANYTGFAYQIGWLHSVFQSAACYHCDLGIMSLLFEGIQLNCAKAFLQGCEDARQGW